mmetsp:Transcript_19769/g.57502  ORF Transcript_19769/g.57502 Transcript_19769/m.57502 type:complete len:227 (-) Transcript_19769:659-1339(-)
MRMIEIGDCCARGGKSFSGSREEAQAIARVLRGRRPCPSHAGRLGPHLRGSVRSVQREDRQNGHLAAKPSQDVVEACARGGTGAPESAATLRSVQRLPEERFAVPRRDEGVAPHGSNHRGPSGGVPLQQRPRPSSARHRDARQPGPRAKRRRASARGDRGLHRGARRRRRSIRPATEEQRIRYDAATPDVDLSAVWPTVEHFRSHIRGRAIDAVKLLGNGRRHLRR